jgi:hypothetical protein
VDHDDVMMIFVSVMMMREEKRGERGKEEGRGKMEDERKR